MKETKTTEGDKISVTAEHEYVLITELRIGGLSPAAELLPVFLIPGATLEISGIPWKGEDDAQS